MINPKWRDGAGLSGITADYASTHRIRVTDALVAEEAAALLLAQRQAPFTLRGHRADHLGWQQGQTNGLDLQYWHCPIQPDSTELPEALTAFARWIWRDGLAWVEQITGEQLAPPPDAQLMATAFTKGSYLDPHNDYDGRRAVAFVFGFTPEPIPPAHGGQLEFLSLKGGQARVELRCPPAFNTLDLFDARSKPRIHRVSLARELMERRALTGWFYTR